MSRTIGRNWQTGVALAMLAVLPACRCKESGRDWSDECHSLPKDPSVSRAMMREFLVPGCLRIGWLDGTGSNCLGITPLLSNGRNGRYYVNIDVQSEGVSTSDNQGFSVLPNYERYDCFNYTIRLDSSVDTIAMSVVAFDDQIVGAIVLQRDATSGWISRCTDQVSRHRGVLRECHEPLGIMLNSKEPDLRIVPHADIGRVGIEDMNRDMVQAVRRALSGNAHDSEAALFLRLAAFDENEVVASADAVVWFFRLSGGEWDWNSPPVFCWPSDLDASGNENITWKLVDAAPFAKSFATSVKKMVLSEEELAKFHVVGP